MWTVQAPHREMPQLYLVPVEAQMVPDSPQEGHLRVDIEPALLFVDGEIDATHARILRLAAQIRSGLNMFKCRPKGNHDIDQAVWENSVPSHYWGGLGAVWSYPRRRSRPGSVNAAD